MQRLTHLRFVTILSALVLVACARGDGENEDGGHVAQLDARVFPDTGTIPDTVCGDSMIEGTEECEGADLDGASCETLGYGGGTLSCNSECMFDKSACVDSRCGNGAIDSGEQCDGAALDEATCVGAGFVSGTLACGTDCDFDTSGCSPCGDGNLDEGEDCDGSALSDATCASRGFTTGTLSCDATCGFDESACINANCGNGTREGEESCDGSDLGGAGCSTVGFFGGTLSCAGDCTYLVTSCHNCGNGSIEGIEQCDGANLAGQSCTTRGFTMGALACNGSCGFDDSGCATAACGNGRIEGSEACDDGNPNNNDGCTSCAVDGGWSCMGAPSSCSPICGNGMIHGGEQCDNTNLGGQSCLARGFAGGGTLRCSSSCNFDTAACISISCGNSVIETSEECDDGNTALNDGCDSACHVEPNFYLPVRLRNGEGTNHGMLEVMFAGAWRDVCDDTYEVAQQQAMADVVCRQLGFTGSGHQFIDSFGGGTPTPVMDDVQCTGSESSLAQCPFRGWGVENCSAIEAVGIRCMPGEGDIRLTGGPSGMEGRLQIFHSGAWGEVCDDYFDGNYDASYYGYSTTTVCQQIGYANGTFLSSGYDAPGDVFALDDVNCTGSERRIDTCPHLAWGTENCTAPEGAGFRCDVYADGAARLNGGTGRNSGRIEVLHNNVWGTVCDDALEGAGALQTNFIAVGCGSLGFERSGSALVTTAIPDGTDPIWLDDVACAGGESSVQSCPTRGWAIHNCSHYEDIGLTCTP